MPKESEKIKLLKGLCLQHALDLNVVASESDNEEDFTLKASLLLQNRRGTHFGLPKSINWAENVLPNMDEDRMRQMLRVNAQQFLHISSLIENNAVFHTESVSPQMPIHLQLKIRLFRLGSNGDSASVRKIATLFGVGDRGTVAIDTKRVICALMNLRAKYLFWSAAEEREQIVAKTMHELPGCIGYIDGTEIRLAKGPALNHELYFSRKRQYAVKLQVVCDHLLRIRHAVIGHYGSVHDARIFAECSIAQAPEKFFSKKQYIAGDSAYPLSNNIVTPFRLNSNEFTEEIRAKFNEHHSKYRVRIENCLGNLKEVYCSLKELRFHLHNEENYKDCCNWILACCILHNILIEFENPENADVSGPTDYPEEMRSTNNIRAALVAFISQNY